MPFSKKVLIPLLIVVLCAVSLFVFYLYKNRNISIKSKNYNSENSVAGKYIPETVIKIDSSGMLLDKSNVLFLKVYDPQNTKDWADFKLVWGYITTNSLPNQDDYTKSKDPKLLIVASGGLKSTGGHSINIDSVEYSTSKELVISIKETLPAKNCFVTEAISKSYHVVSIPKKVYTSYKPNFKAEIKECK